MSTADLPLDSDPDWLGCEAMLSVPGFALFGSLAAALCADPGQPAGAGLPGGHEPPGDPQIDPMASP